MELLSHFLHAIHLCSLLSQIPCNSSSRKEDFVTYHDSTESLALRVTSGQDRSEQKILKTKLDFLFFHFGIPTGRERECSLFHQPERYQFEFKTHPASKETILQFSGRGRAFSLMGQKARFLLLSSTFVKTKAQIISTYMFGSTN